MIQSFQLGFYAKTYGIDRKKHTTLLPFSSLDQVTLIAALPIVEEIENIWWTSANTTSKLSKLHDIEAIHKDELFFVFLLILEGHARGQQKSVDTENERKRETGHERQSSNRAEQNQILRAAEKQNKNTFPPKTYQKLATKPPQPLAFG